VNASNSGLFCGFLELKKPLSVFTGGINMAASAGVTPTSQKREVLRSFAEAYVI
jgi:hypothetical protein